jgi:hypothetical protein
VVSLDARIMGMELLADLGYGAARLHWRRAATAEYYAAYPRVLIPRNAKLCEDPSVL